MDGNAEGLNPMLHRLVKLQFDQTSAHRRNEAIAVRAAEEAKGKPDAVCIYGQALLKGRRRWVVSVEACLIASCPCIFR